MDKIGAALTVIPYNIQDTNTKENTKDNRRYKYNIIVMETNISILLMATKLLSKFQIK